VINPVSAFRLIVSQVNVAVLTDVAVVPPKVQVPDADRAPVVDREETEVTPKVQAPEHITRPVLDRTLPPKETG